MRGSESILRPLVLEIFGGEPDAGFWLYRVSAGLVLDRVAGPFESKADADAAAIEMASRC